MPKRVLYEAGHRFEGTRLTVLENLPAQDGRGYVFCRCDCGKAIDIRTVDITTKNTRSCGCLHLERAPLFNQSHGLSNHPIFTLWKNIKSRCENKNSPDFLRYGGRGISVCPEWGNDFIAFYDWAIENGWWTGLQIDRIDNNGNYEPGNCRFVTQTENGRNTRKNILVTINGITATLSEHAERVGMNYATVKSRYRMGWKEEDLLLPSRVRNRWSKREGE
jgi:hypothetical protein